MNKAKKHVVVFAGNECSKEKETYYYSVAYDTGKLLAKFGYITVTGGGPGLMNEVCRGAVENGGDTIGICLTVAGRVNSKYLTRKELFNHLNPRQQRLLNLGDAFIAIPGGIGTHYEVFAVVSLKRKLDIPFAKPMILVDGFFEPFEQLMEHIYKNGFAAMDVKKLYTMVKNPAEAIGILSKNI